MIIQPHSKLLMIGSSVTDSERAHPIGEGRPGSLGKGYVSFVDGLLWARYPAHRIRVVNMGANANNVRHLKERWQTDVLDLKPDWVSIASGINDAFYEFYRPHIPETHVPLAEYRQTLEKLVQLTKPTLKGLILMTPFFVEPNKAEPVRAKVDVYGAAVKQIAEKYQAIFVDTQAAFDAVLTHMHPVALALDRIHPTHVGHMILARAFLQALGYEWE